MVSARKHVTVLFLILMVLSSIGYYPFLSLVKQQASLRTKNRIENNPHDLGANMIIKVPFSYPYGAHDEHYQPASGEIMYKDTVYQLVRQRVYEDTLYIVCMRDTRTTEAQGRVAGYVMSFSTENKHQSQSLSLVDVFTKYYYQTALILQLNGEPCAGISAFGSSTPVLYYYTPLGEIFHPPGLTS